MSKYFDFYKKRVLGNANNIIDSNRQSIEDDFERYLTDDAVTAYEISYTKPDELPDLQKNSKELMAILDIADNDKTNHDEKKLLCRNSCPIDVGSYVYWNKSYYIVIFEDVVSTMSHKKYVLKRCNNFVNIKYNGKVYEMPTAMVNLTMYSKGIHDYGNISIGDAKRTLFVGCNEVTRAMQVGYRLLYSDTIASKITHVNDFEYTRRSDGGVGLIRWLTSETTILIEDDVDNLIAYNPISEGKVANSVIDGNDDISMGVVNTYSIEYDGVVTWQLDKRYMYTSLTDFGDNSCKIEQQFDETFSQVGIVIGLIAQDEEGNTINIKNITIRGL